MISKFDFELLRQKDFAPNEFLDSEKAAELKVSNIPADEKIFNNLKFISSQAQGLRDLLCKPIKINRGYSCPQVNNAVGGKPNSQHLKGEAIDFICPPFTPQQILKLIKKYKFPVDQIIAEKKTIKGRVIRWVHYSCVNYRQNRNEFLNGDEGRYSKFES